MFSDPIFPDPIFHVPFFTYLGGRNDDWAYALVVTADAVYVAGITLSPDFPGTAGGAQGTCANYVNYQSYCDDAFVAKLDLDLHTLTQSTYLGSSGEGEGATALAVTADGVYVAGKTNSTDFPGVAGGAQGTSGGNRQDSEDDAFVAKLSRDLRALTQSTYLGGSSYDQAFALTVTADAVYVAGITSSPNFPGAAGGAQGTLGGSPNAFVAQLDLTLTAACASNVTAHVSVTRGGFRLNHATGRFVQTLSLENTGATSLQSPISLTLDGLSGSAALYHQSGTTTCAPPLGSPYVNVNVGADNALTPGEVTTVHLEFDNPTHQGITYTTRVLAASGDR